MKSKKIIIGIAIVAVLVIGGVALNISSKDSSTTDEQPTTNTETKTPTDSATDSNSTDSNSTTASTTNENAANGTSNEAAANNESAANNTTDSTSENFSSQDAAAKIIRFYIGEEDISSQHLTPISLEGNVTKKQDSSNTYYSNTTEFVENADKGLIIILDNYNESAKTYNYTLKDLFSLKKGVDEPLGTGTVASNGTVTEES